MSKITPGPWGTPEYDEHAGDDCMTCGVRIGHVTLDGRDYGQDRRQTIKPDALERMMADARAISAVPEMMDALETLIALHEETIINNTTLSMEEATEELAPFRAALAKARGETP